MPDECTRVYLQDNNEVEYYRSLGIEIHTGPQGGTYICLEDIKHQRTRSKNTVRVNELRNFQARLSALGKYKIRKQDAGVDFVFEDGSLIHVGSDYLQLKIGNILDWKVPGDDPVLLMVGFRLLSNAVSDIGLEEDDVRSRFSWDWGSNRSKFLFDGLDFILREDDNFAKLARFLVLESLRIGRDFVDDVIGSVEDVDTFRIALMYVLGPWVANNNLVRVNVNRLSEDFIEVVNSRDFWNFLIDSLRFSAFGNWYGLPTSINFVDRSVVSDIYGVDDSWGLYSYSTGDIYYIVSRESVPRYSWIGILWHEFGHFVDYSYDLSEYGYFTWLKLSLSGKIGKYASENITETVAEWFAYYLGGFSDDKDVFDVAKYVRYVLKKL